MKQLLLAGLAFTMSLCAGAQSVPTTNNFAVAPAFSSTYSPPIWNDVVTMTIGGKSYTFSGGINGSFMHQATGGNANSASVYKDASGGDNLVIKRADNTAFTINGFWLKHSSMFNPPFYQPPYYTITYNLAGGGTQTSVMNTQNSTDVYTPNLIVTSVSIYFTSLLSYNIDDIMVSDAVFTQPASQTSGITFNNVSATSTKITWANGSGTNRVVVVKQGNTGSFTPVNNTTYPTSSNFTSATNAIGAAGWRGIYKSTGSTVTVTNLLPNTTYKVMIFEYNGTAASEVYNTTVASNTASFINGATLPVGLISFHASLQGDKALLTWATATEHNSKGFEVQTSGDGKSWTICDFVPSGAENGNSNAVLQYSYLAGPLTAGTHFYRLNMVDKDSRHEYSNVVTVRFLSDGHNLLLYPNPATALIKISGMPASDMEYILCDLSGRIVQYGLVNSAGAIDVSKLNRGSYTIRFTAGNKQFVQQLIKK